MNQPRRLHIRFHLQFLQRYGGFKVPVDDLLDEDLERMLGRNDIPEEIKQGLVVATGRRGEKLRDRHIQDEYEGDLYVPKPLPRAKMEALESPEVSTVAPLKWVDLKYVLPPLPKRGDFDVSRTKQSKYFFS